MNTRHLEVIHHRHAARQGKRVLVVEDDRLISYNLVNGLTDAGYAATDVAYAHLVPQLADKWHPDVALVDLQLPDYPGFEGGIQVIRNLRAWSPALGIIVLTIAVDNDINTAAARAGADDYLTKPYVLEMLLAHVDRACERSIYVQTYLPERDAIVPLGPGTTLDRSTHKVTKDGAATTLTRKQFSLLDYFVANAGRTLPYDVIIEHCWGHDSVDESMLKTLMVFVSQLRRIIETDPSNPQLLVNDRRVGGYMLRIPARVEREQ